MVLATQEVEVGGSQTKAGQQKFNTLSEKQTKSKWTEGMGQVVECFPSKFKGLN
jgi:hypothetical protein